MQAIKAKNISKSFGTTKAVNNISFNVASGEIVGLLGPNGAGKTTTIRMILDIFKPDTGSISVLGGPMNETKKNQIGYLPEERGLYQDITLDQCLSYLASLKGLGTKDIKDRLETYLDSFDLLDYRFKKVKEMSKGMQQKAQLITAFIHLPKLVIVDEPFSALDPVNTQMAKDLLREERANGTAIVMSTHQMNQAEELCDRILLIHKGQIVLKGKLDEIKSKFAKQEILVKAVSALPLKIEGVDFVEPENQHHRLYIKEGVAAKDILADLVKKGIELERFEIEQPSLDEIFIQTVTGKVG
ncbi:MAG TPA: ATP-binding cassette domain-containing protein [Pelolinea sp.]|nr:ATP-binding cassette domain-containing protein [Pelolinea sp.]